MGKVIEAQSQAVAFGSEKRSQQRYYPARQGTDQSNRLGDLFGVPSPK